MRVGFVGWRGMVGSVLMERMLAENDFADIEPIFFTTSNVGGQGPSIGKDIPTLKTLRILQNCLSWTPLFLARVVTTPNPFFLIFAQVVGMAIGLMRPPVCVCPMMQSLYWTL